MRRASLVPGSPVGPAPPPPGFPWELAERCILPVIFAHAAAAILSVLISLFGLPFTTLRMFLWIAPAVLAALFFFHNLKVNAAGKAVLVTGCESRIGFALARQLDELGFTVFAGFEDTGTERSSDCTTTSALKEQSSGRVHILQLDVSSEEQIQKVKEYVQDNLPRGASGIWAVVNLGVWACFGEAEWLPFAAVKRCAEVNLLGAIRLTQIFLPQLRRTKGRVVNVVSALGSIPTPMRSPYCACAAAIRAFSDCLRLEMRRWGVDVVVVTPGESLSGSFLTEERLVDQARSMWAWLGDAAKGEIGQDYFEMKVRSLRPYVEIQQPEPELYSVLRALTDGVSRTFPLPRYQPVPPQERLKTFVAEYFPRSFYEIIYG
ncbi:D-beta-hydroxybutyrate dehydrogenase, mitochondrial-like [Hetaerina americana]|uniref:D-beta-hydroxybutyrate dehydrogenase, mitochondrial-like n=1 Tax=Hetaerina americana TaxID=62018 RepID=UPI003A7F1761